MGRQLPSRLKSALTGSPWVLAPSGGEGLADVFSAGTEQYRSPIYDDPINLGPAASLHLNPALLDPPHLDQSSVLQISNPHSVWQEKGRRLQPLNTLLLQNLQLNDLGCKRW